MRYYKTNGLENLKNELMMYTWNPKPEEIKPMKITVFSDLELHDDGSLHLDGLSVRNSNMTGDGVVTFIRSENVLEFLESAIKIHAQLKKKGLLPKPAKEVKP